MNKLSGVNIFTRLIAEYAEVSLEEALSIQKYIDEWLQIDWSEATSNQIEATIEVAQGLMREKA